jgi:hypothetical protein
MVPLEQENTEYSMGERRGSAVAHASALVVGVPVLLFFVLFGGSMPLFVALTPCPVVSYMIARSFRRRQKPWGAFQGMQASLAQLLLVFLAFVSSQLDFNFKLVSTLGFIGVLVLLYTLWGAWETLFGYDFRYIGISNLMDHVSYRNMARRELRRRWFRGSQPDDEHYIGISHLPDSESSRNMARREPRRRRSRGSQSEDDPAQR